MTANTAELRRSISSDDGQAKTKALASLVGVMIVAAVAALILVAFNHSSKSHTATGSQPSASDVGRQSTPPATATSSAAAPAPATTAAAPTSKPVAAPSATKSSAPTTKPSTPAKSSGTSTSAKKPVTYVVKHGDNLTVIAAWFHQHGYDDLYQLNRTTIGNNPNLIFPGEKITISHGAMTLH